MFKNLVKLLMVGLIFTAVGCNISGTVKDVDGNPMEGVTITLTSSTSEMVTTTDADGEYTFTDLAQAKYTVTPTLEGTMFEPESKTVSLSWSNVSAHFVQYLPPAPPEPPTYDLTGNFIAEVTSQVAIQYGGGVVFMAAYIEQTGNTFTMELVDYENAVIEGTIEGAVYTGTKFPEESIKMDFGSVIVSVKFKSMVLTALNADSFTATFSISGSALGISLSDKNVTAEGYRID